MNIFGSTSGLVLVLSTSTSIAVVVRRILARFAPRLVGKLPAVSTDIAFLLVGGSLSLGAAAKLIDLPQSSMAWVTTLCLLLSMGALVVLVLGARKSSK